MSDARRTQEIAKIHCLRRDLKLDEDTYRDLLQSIAGVRSAGELDAAGRRLVIEAMKKDAGPDANRYPGRPHNADSRNARPEMTKLEALLANQKLPWAYADGIAEHMYKVKRVAWCTSDQLRGIITALVMRQKKLDATPPPDGVA